MIAAFVWVARVITITSRQKPFKCKPPEVHFTIRNSVPYNKQLTNRACSSRTGEYWPSVVEVRTSLRSVRTATTSGQYSPARPSRLVSKRLVYQMILPNPLTIFFKIFCALFARKSEIIRKITIFQSLTLVALRKKSQYFLALKVHRRPYDPWLAAIQLFDFSSTWILSIYFSYIFYLFIDNLRRYCGVFIYRRYSYRWCGTHQWKL